MSALKFRAVEASDCGQLVLLLKELADVTGLGGKFEATSDQLELALAHQPPLFHGLIAEVSGQALGVCLYYPQFSTWRGEAGVYVLDLIVREHARGRSIGRKLLGAVCRDAFEKWQANYMSLDVDHLNQDGHAFYRRLGFVEDLSNKNLRLYGPPFQKAAGR